MQRESHFKKELINLVKCLKFRSLTNQDLFSIEYKYVPTRNGFIEDKSTNISVSSASVIVANVPNYSLIYHTLDLRCLSTAI